jgi:hypothetical protein
MGSLRVREISNIARLRAPRTRCFSEAPSPVIGAHKAEERLRLSRLEIVDRSQTESVFQCGGPNPEHDKRIAHRQFSSSAGIFRD